MRFRKRPVVIEAEQFFPDRDWPAGVVATTNTAVWGPREAPIERIHIIKTMEGPHIVRPGDWVITGIKGERYPCNNDIFQSTYERVEDE